jgi:two-component system chemotaxis response regulator CheY
MSKVVLVVDDSVTIRQELALVLAPEGFHVVEAADGVDALARVRAGGVALILCDVNMPRMNGLEFLDKLNGLGLQVPVLMLTTEGEPESIERARKAGAKGWIIKPFKASLLIAAVKQLTA